MSSTASWRTFASALSAALLAGCATHPALLYADDFQSTENWVLESERPARVVATHSVLDIDAPAGLTLWFRPRLEGPLTIEFEATAISSGGPDDAVSDLNVFWMASNRDGVEPVYATPRSGAFAQYNNLLTYYVGLGGNRNTTGRFRRYIGDPDVRPLLPAHDLSTPDVLLVANRKQTITLIAAGSHIEYRRDGRSLFQLEDSAPYVRGWFALRTTRSHLQIRRLRIYRRPGS